MYKLSKKAKAGTALTLAATTALGLTGCGSETKELDATDVTTTGIYETGEMPSQNIELIETTEAETKPLEINYGIIKEIREDINSIYKKYFGKENDSEKGIILKGGDNNIYLGEDFNVYYPEDSVIQNTENKYIINLSISAINNSEALNGFLKEVLEKYNIDILNITDEALSLVNIDINKVHTLNLCGTSRVTEPVNLERIKSGDTIILNNVNAYNFPKSTDSLNIHNKKEYCENIGIEKYDLAYEIEEIEFLPNLSYLNIDGVDLNFKSIKTTAEIISLNGCKGYIDVLSTAKDLSLFYENIDGDIVLYGEYEYLFIHSDNEDVLCNLSHSVTLNVNFETIDSPYTR